MIIDTSAWVDFSRDVTSPLRTAVDAAVAAKSAMTTDVIRLELLAGLDWRHRRAMSGVLAGCQFVPQKSLFDVNDAIELFQECRRRGDTIRSPNDCVIAAVALRVGVSVLHRDRDFDVLARHTGLAAVRQ